MKWNAPFGSKDESARYVNASPLAPGSNPPAEFFNSVQEEILNVLKEAEITPADGDNAQLYKSIVAIVQRLATGGPLTAYNFEEANPSDATLTEYAAKEVWGDGGVFAWNADSPHTSTYTIDGEAHSVEEIFDNTWVRNTFNNHRWVLSNKPEPNLTFSWQDVGIDTVADANETTAGILKLYQNSGQNTDGTMSQKAVTDLIAPVAIYDVKSWKKRFMVYEPSDATHKTLRIEPNTSIRLNVDGVDRFWSSGTSGVTFNAETLLDSDQFGLDSRVDTGAARTYLDCCLVGTRLYGIVSGTSTTVYWTDIETNERGTITIASGSHTSICAIGQKLYITRGGTTATIDVHDLTTSTNSTITLSASINQLMLRARGTRLYATNRNSATNLCWYETSDNTKGALVLGASTGHNSIAFIGDKMYVTRLDSATTIDTYDLTAGTTGTITGLPNKIWQGLAVLGDKLIAVNSADIAGYVIDPETGTYQTRMISTKMNPGYNHLANSTTEKVFVVANGSDRYIWSYENNLGKHLKNGTQYYVYLAPDGDNCKLVVSANNTFPTGYTAENTRKIGSFHTECADIPLSQTGMIDGQTVTHRLAGWRAGDILPQSVTCLTYAPECDLGGMVNLSNKPDTWVAIYLLCGTANAPTWGYGQSVLRNVQEHNLLFAPTRVKCHALDDAEFYQAAEQSPQKTNVFGSAELSNFVAGGHYDTAYQRMVSKDGVEETNGLVWQVMNDYSSAGGDGWNAMDGGEGDRYGNCMTRLAGGRWDDGSHCGGRTRDATHSLSLSHSYVGGRAASHTKVTD